ncbi:MAG: PKD domain-containing protein, partial [Bacteroidia bacterium]|nr:PKD domain-containing protein [Bacteroidia bacterium]
TQFQPGSHTYFAPDDSFRIRLVVDTAGYCFDSTSVWIKTASWPQAAFTQDLTVGCAQETVRFTNQSTSAALPLTYQWDFGNASTSTLFNPLPVTYSQPAAYPVQLIATNSYQCKDTATGQFILYPQPDARFAMSDSTICAPGEVQFTNQSTNFSHSSWRFGDGFGSNDDNPAHNFFYEDTTLWITLVVDTAGICVDSTRRRIRTASYPIAAFTPSDVQFCGNENVRFTNRSITNGQPLSYVWTFGNGRTSTLVQPTTTYAVGDLPIDFTTRLIATNTFGCADTAERIIAGLPQPNVAFAPVYAGKCSPLQVQFLNLSTGFNSSSWSFSNGATSDSTSPMQTFGVGDWDVKLVVSWDGQCFDSLLALREIHVEQSAVADFSWDLNTTDKPDGTVAFLNRSFFANDYLWQFGDGAISTEEDPIHRYMSNGPFEVQLIANNAANCPDTATATEFRPLRFGGIFVPNAMAPGSGVDSADVFLPVAVGICEGSYRVEVFDTFGNLLWASEETDNGRPSEAWDGTVTDPSSRPQAGGPVSNVDVYLWQVSYKFEGECDENTRPRVKQGTLTVIR